MATEPTATEGYVCNFCGEEFPTATSLEEHKKTHSRPESSREHAQQDFRGDIGAAGMPTSGTP